MKKRFLPPAEVHEGIYTEIDVRKRREGEPVLAGHVALVTDDGQRWQEAAIRPADERAQWSGRRVRITGAVMSRAPQDPRGSAHPIGPCFVSIEAIAPA